MIEKLFCETTSSIWQSEAVSVALITSAVTVIIAVGGWTLTYFLQANGKKLRRLEDKVGKLHREVQARIEQENEACMWLGQLTGRTAESIKRELRNRCEERTNLRPTMSPSELRT